MNASLDEKLNNVKWGEFRLGDLFEILSYKRKFDANKIELVGNCGHPYIVRTSNDNGQKGYIDEAEEFLNEGNTISFGQDTATMYYQEVPYFTGDKIKILKSKFFRFNKANAQFYLASMRKAFQCFSWGSSRFNISVISNQKINLPITQSNEIDFDFMESFMSELEQERINKLKAYLEVTGLKDYELTEEEKKILKDSERWIWKEYSITEIFDVNNTHNILSSDIMPNSGKTPYLCASSENNGVNTYISYKKDLIEKGNCIFIGGKTFVVSFQKDDFYSNDSHNLVLYLKKTNATVKNQLFLASCVNKGMKHKYSWGDSISGSKIRKDTFKLPSQNSIPDFTSMEIFIRAIEKLVIKDVVMYANKKTAAAKELVYAQSTSPVFAAEASGYLPACRESD